MSAEKKSFTVRVNAELCKSCGYCKELCPKQVYDFGEEMNAAGYKYMDISSASAPAELKQMLGNGEYTVDKMLPLKGKTLVVNRVPIRVREHDQGTIIVFQELSKIQQIEAEARVQLASKGLVAKYDFSDIIGSKSTLGQVVAEAKRYADSAASILIEGETGSGKELFAQSIHNFSKRHRGPFVALNCAALPEHLLESELFGYEEGAFTGARKGGKAGMQTLPGIYIAGYVKSCIR